MDVETFIRAYIEAALWTSTTGDDGTPLDRDHDLDDLAPQARAIIADECRSFMAANAADLELSGLSAESAGHDFWLTRNRHGAGYWDRGLADELGRRLTDAAQGYGESDLYLGDDGRLYVT